MNLTKINNEIIKPLKSKNKPINPNILIPSKFPNVMLVGRKNSGKTSLINHILKAWVKKDMNIDLFCRTLDKDDSWVQICKMLDKKKGIVLTHQSLDEEGIDVLDMIRTDTEPTKPNIICLDDISGELGKKSLEDFLKVNRHQKSKVIISTQYWTDLAKPSRCQIDFLILFRGQELKQIQSMHRELNLPIPYEKFLDLYQKSTSEKYSFLFCNVSDGSFRKKLHLGYKTSDD